MAENTFDPDAYVSAASAMIGLEIAPEHRPGVVINVQRVAEMAALLMAFPLPDDTEAAPVYRP